MSEVKALILVDLQNDFLPTGTLPVRSGDKVIRFANSLLQQQHFDFVIATQDWHPANHSSFKSNDPVLGLWPDHCVQGTPGASFASELHVEFFDHVVRKGTNPAIDSYSGFYDNDHKNKTGLEDLLRRLFVEEVYVLGVATDYCVKFTVLDSLKCGFRTFVYGEGCQGIDVIDGDCERALIEMVREGAKLI